MSSPLLSTLGIVCPACDCLNPARSPQCAACGAAFFAPAAAEVAQTPAADPEAAYPGSPSGRLSPLVESVLAAQPPSRPKPPTLVRHEGAPPPSAPAAAPPIPLRSAAPGPTAPRAIPAAQAPRKRAAPPAQPARAPAAGAIALAVVAGSARGQRYPIPATGSWVGRNRGNILFPEDVFVSGHHAALTLHEGRLRVRDEGTASGVFVSIAGQEMIAHGTLFSIGRRLLRYLGHLQPALAAISGELRVYGAPLPQGSSPCGVEEILVGGRPGRAVISGGLPLTIGQMNCDFCFPHDEGVAARHCEVTPVAEGAVLRDLSGALRTFVRIPPGSDRVLNPGDRLRIGQQLLQVETV